MSRRGTSMNTRSLRWAHLMVGCSVAITELINYLIGTQFDLIVVLFWKNLERLLKTPITIFFSINYLEFCDKSINR